MLPSLPRALFNVSGPIHLDQFSLTLWSARKSKQMR
jgi:hypothetical protein